jgi:hypothetical protein
VTVFLLIAKATMVRNSERHKKGAIQCGSLARAVSAAALCGDEIQR